MLRAGLVTGSGVYDTSTTGSRNAPAVRLRCYRLPPAFLANTRVSIHAAAARKAYPMTPGKARETCDV